MQLDVFRWNKGRWPACPCGFFAILRRISALIYVSCGGLYAGRAFLIPRHLPRETMDIPAKQYNSWLRDTKTRFRFLSNTEGIQKNSEAFRRNLDRIRHSLDVFGVKFRQNLRVNVAWLGATGNPFQKPIENVALNSGRPHRFGLV